MIRPVIIALLLAGPASAGVEEAVTDNILPATARFAAETAALATVAEDNCTAEALRPGYHASFDAWLGLSHLRFGPLEENGRVLAIGFWPDTRGLVADTVQRLIAETDPIVDDPDGFADVSVAGRGLFALERLLFETEYEAGDYPCALARAIVRDLARMGSAIDRDWRTAHADLLINAGAENNNTYLNPREALQTLYTALTTGLAFNADQRLGRPLGSFERPRPERAEARRSQRSLRNVILSLEAQRALAVALADGPIPATEAAFTRALGTARALDDPIFAGVATPQGRLRVEVLQQDIAAIGAEVTKEIGAALGVSAGFNSADGD